MMKWQEFYFNWLENIGYFKWWNATLVGHKTPYPVGGRTGSGTVCFGGEGGIEGFPSTPTASHPAQPLIDSALEDTGTLDTNQIRRAGGYGRRGGVSANLIAYLDGDDFGESQKNTLRYWGVQPEGSTFLPDSNFYRGYEYFINAMKQKYELRGPRGSRLLTEKDWLTDKKNRTYPTTRRQTTGQMIASKHPDYQDYADIGNIMQIEWGVFNGYSNLLYSPVWSQETWNEGQDASTVEATTWMDERTASGKDVIMRNKLFDEKNYIPDKLKHELLQEMTQILLRELPEISMITAETILQYISLNMIGLNMEGHPTTPDGYTETLEALPISFDIITQLKRLLCLWPDSSEGAHISFYLNFPCSSLLLAPKQLSGQNNSPIRSVTVFENQCQNADFGPNYNHEIAGAYKTFVQHQGTDIGFITNILEWWETFMIVDESLQPFIESFRNMFNILVDRNNEGRGTEETPNLTTLTQTADSELSNRMTYWLFTIPSWVNVDYAMAIATYFVPEGDYSGTGGRANQGLDIVPKEINFDLESGEPKYTYEITLSEWWLLYQSPEPSISDLRYWNIYTAFIHPSTKRTRGMETPELIEIHAINLYPSVQPLEAQTTRQKFNNISISNVQNAESIMNGAINNGEEIPQITYKFWDEGQYWPDMKITTPDNSTGGVNPGYGRRSRGQGNIGDLRSFLTPMTTIHNEWWNEFLGENGILSMQTEPNPDNPQIPNKMGLGWELGWSWIYMEDLIWTNRLKQQEWANNLNLQDFAERVYPTLPMNLSFEPKLPPNTNLIQRPSTAAQAGFRDYKVGATKQEDELFRTNRRNFWEDDGGGELTAVETYTPFSGMEVTTTRGYENSFNYVITSGINALFMDNANSLRQGEWVWKSLKSGNTQPTHIFNNSITLEDDDGNIAFIPDNAPYLRSFDDEKWAEVRAATGYMNEVLNWGGSHENMNYQTLQLDLRITAFSDMPKIVIGDMPDDIFEMEELTDLSNKTIDYTAPSSSPWRRGKIPLINWAAILSNKIISMIMPQEED